MRQDDFELLQGIRTQGYRSSDATNNAEHEISARQGSSLAQLLHEGGYRWNTGDGTIQICEGKHLNSRLPQYKIILLGPNKTRLDALEAWWTSEIRQMGWVGPLENLDDIFEYLCSHEVVVPNDELLSSSDELATAYVRDNSVTNGSSISLIVEIEGRRLLFLGDSYAEDNVAALTATGPSIFDAVKIAHHGSSRNTSLDLLALVDSPHFFISTNGDGHNHPDFSVLKAIVDRPAAFFRTLHFNYSTPMSRKLRMYQSAVGSDFIVIEEESGWIAINTPKTT